MRWYVRLPILSNGLLLLSNIELIRALWIAKSSAGHSVGSWVLVVVSILLQLVWILKVVPRDRQFWAVVGNLLSLLFVGSILLLVIQYAS